jgi:hypothetical protein
MEMEAPRQGLREGEMSNRNDAESRVVDRFALTAGCIVSLAALWYASEVLRRTSPRGGPLLTACALFLLGLSLVAEGRAHRLRGPLRWTAMALVAAGAVWLRA